MPVNGNKTGREEIRRFEELLHRLSGKNWRTLNLRDGQLIPAKEFARYCRRMQVGIQPILRLLILNLTDTVSNEFQKQLLAELDFSALGDQVEEEDPSVARIQTLLYKFREVRIDRDHQQQFFNQLDYEKLAEKADVTNRRPSSILSLITKFRQAGVSKSNRSRFCQRLDYVAMGTRARELPVTTINSFLKVVDDLNVPLESILKFCQQLDFSALGRKAYGNKLGIITLDNFLSLVRRAGVADAALAVFWQELDMRFLGAQTGKGGVKSSAVLRFIKRVCSMELPPLKRREFLRELNFRELGKKVSRKGLGLKEIKDFLDKLRLAGVGKSAMREFGQTLNYRLLAKQAILDAVGIATIKMFMELLQKIELSENLQRDFFNRLDFKLLAEKARDESVGILTLLRFQVILNRLGTQEVQRTFNTTLDFHDLGTRAVNSNGAFIFPTRLLGVLTKAPGVDKEKVLRFIDGCGWKRMKQAALSLPPDLYAALQKLLVEKCELTVKTLQEKGISQTEKDWLYVFTNNPCRRTNGFSKTRHERFQVALHGLTGGDDDWAFLTRTALSLKAWNILIYNLQTTGYEEIGEKISPILRDKSPYEYEALLSDATLKDIGIFLNNYNPTDGIFAWPLPNTIDFSKLDFSTALRNSSLPSIAYFLFNFFYIGRTDCAHFFGEQIDADADLLLHTLEASDLKTIDFFAWNWFLTLPTNYQPKLFGSPKFHQLLIRKAKHSSVDFFFGIIGTMQLSGSSIPEYLAGTIHKNDAKRICQRASDRNKLTLLRYLAGLRKITQEISNAEKAVYLRSIHALKKQTRLNIPKQSMVMAKLEKWLGSAFTKKRRK